MFEFKETPETFRKHLTNLLKENEIQGYNVRLLELMHNQALNCLTRCKLNQAFFRSPDLDWTKPDFCNPLKCRTATLYRISQKYKVSLDYLLELSDEPALNPKHYRKNFHSNVNRNSLSARLKNIMKTNNLSLTDLSKLVGVHRGTAKKWLTKIDIPSVTCLVALTKAFPTMSADALLCEGGYV